MRVVKALFLLCLVGASVCAPSNVGIIGGHQITIEQVPFMVSLRVNGTRHCCGGSIISERFVLTAAHCIKTNSTFKILVGTDRVDNGGELYDIENYIIHKKYNSTTFNFDICLLKLAKPLVFSKKVAAIKLADKTVKVKKNTELSVTGWGSTGRKELPTHLRQVTVPMVTKIECQRLYEKLKITHQMICAGKKGEDSCQGDSGGPLTKGDYQVGITSFGVGCGQVPGVYVKVATVQPWILRMMKKYQ